MGYQAFVMIPPTTEASLDQAQLALSSNGCFRDTTIGQEPIPWDQSRKRIVVKYQAGWSSQIYFNTNDYVIEESQEIADRFAKDESLKNLLSRCDRRFEISTDDDPNMDHFNDYIFTLEAFEELPGAVLFDQASGDFV